MNWSDINWMAILPELIVFSTAAIALVSELIFSSKLKRTIGIISLAGLIVALASLIPNWYVSSVQFNGMFTVDITSNVLKFILLITTALVVLALQKTHLGVSEGDFYSLILFSVLGTMLMASATDLILLFIALELTVIPAYILTAIKRTAQSSEAALKYFLLGVISSVVLLYGMTLLFGLTGATTFAAIGSQLRTMSLQPTLVVAMLMIIVGLGFKVAAVPFHFWAPDVYEGAPVSVASYLSAGPKAGGFAALIHLFPVALAVGQPAWISVFAIVSVISMILGNFAALSQTRVRRLLGYSAVAHTGYLLVGMAVANKFGYSSLIFYFFVYSLAALGAFLVVLALTEHGFGEDVTDFAGLYRRAPLLSVAMAIFLFSLIGLPPFAGFMGKLFLFGSAVNENLIWLAIFGVLNSVVSFGYYVSVIRQMYLAKPDTLSRLPVPLPLYASIVIIMFAVIILGVYPNAFMAIIQL